MLLAEKFNQALVKTYGLESEKVSKPNEEHSLFLKYVQPYLAVPLFKENNNAIFELELFQNFNEDIKFTVFNRPWGDFKISDDKFGQIRMPHAFSHWTYVATDGKYIVTDV